MSNPDQQFVGHLDPGEWPCQQPTTGCGRCRGNLEGIQASNATVRSPANRMLGVCGYASGPATTSNKAFNGAGPVAAADPTAPSPTGAARPVRLASMIRAA